MTDKYRPAVAATAAVLEALTAVQNAAVFERQDDLLDAIEVLKAAAFEARDCAVNNLADAERWEKHKKMIVVAKDYYTALDDADTTDQEAINKLKVGLDLAIEPFSDDPAFVAFLQMKRAAAEVTTEEEKKLDGPEVMTNRLAFRRALAKEAAYTATLLEAITKDQQGRSQQVSDSAISRACTVNAEYVETLAMAARMREYSIRQGVEREENNE